MGWTSYPMHKPLVEWFEEEYLNSKNHKALKTSLVGSTIFSAVQDLKTLKVSAYVFLTSINNKEDYNFAYKDLHEEVGPCQHNCPKGIIKLLSPTEHEYAIGWRKRVEEYHEKKARERKAIKAGLFFKMKEPIEFSNGIGYQYFKKEGKNFYAYRKVDEKIERIGVKLSPNIRAYTEDFVKDIC